MTQLQYLEDLIDLKIKSISDLPERKRTKYEKLEKEVKRKYKAPSLTAYLLYEHHFKYQDIKSLSSKLGTTYSVIYTIMHNLELPLRTISEAQLINRIVLEKRIEKEHNVSLGEYIFNRFHIDDCSVKDLAKELRRSHQGVYDLIDDLGIPLKIERGALKGKTYEERFGAKRAAEIKARFSGSNSPNYGKPMPKKIRDKISRILTGRKRKPK